MLEIVLAALLGLTPQGGTVYTADGGRLRGTVLDAGAGGVTVQLADGSTRKLEAAQVNRVDFADGTSWKPSAAPPAAAAAQAPQPSGQAAPASPAPPAAVVAAAPATSRPTTLQIPPDKLDTVYLGNGGRVRCLVVESGPDGVVVRLVDGAERRYAPGQVSRIDWSDGTRSDLAATPSAAAPPAAAPPAAASPAAAPPAAAPPAPR